MASKRPGELLLKKGKAGQSHITWMDCSGAMLLSALSCASPGFARAADSAPQAATASISGRVSVASLPGRQQQPLRDHRETDRAGACCHLAGSSLGYRRAFRIHPPGARELQAGSNRRGLQAVVRDGGARRRAGRRSGRWFATEFGRGKRRGQRAKPPKSQRKASARPRRSASNNSKPLPLRTGKFTEALSVSPSVIKTQEGRLNFNGQAESQGMLLVDGDRKCGSGGGKFRDSRAGRRHSVHPGIQYSGQRGVRRIFRGFDAD